MGSFSIKEFLPTIKFLGKFVGIYVLGSFIYGMYVTAYYPKPDPMTHWVTVQTANVLSVLGWSSTAEETQSKPTSIIRYREKSILAVYEGCSGLNVMLIFVAFLVAFGPLIKPLLWFIPLGLLLIHLTNLMRITLLFLVSIYMRDLMYFTHKYFFTAILYVIVFILWVWWVKKFMPKKTIAD